MPLRGRPDPPLRQRVLPALPRGAPGPAAGRGAPAVRLAGGPRRPGLAGARLPRPRPGDHAVRRVAGDPVLPRAVDRPDQGAHPRRRRELQAGAVGLRGRPAGDADPAHLHPARGHHRPLQPAVPDLLRGVVARAGRGRAARAGAGLDRRAALARERPHRRADALRRRADAVPLARRAPRRGGRAAGRPHPGEHQRPADRPGRRAARAADAAPGAGRGLPAVRRRDRPRRRRTTGVPTSGASRSGRSSGSPARACSPR